MKKNPLDLPALGDAPVSPALTVSAIALSLAMNYHDMATVKDGALYQQLKLEQQEIKRITFDDVLETAKKIEAHLMSSSNRISDMLMTGLVDMVNDIAELPPHPGVIIKQEIMDDNNLAVMDISHKTGIEEALWMKILKGEEPIDEATAKKLEEVFGYAAETLLQVQKNYDDAVAKMEQKPFVPNQNQAE